VLKPFPHALRLNVAFERFIFSSAYRGWVESIMRNVVMWHLRTRLGVFWVVPISESMHQYYLGIDDQELGIYADAEQAARDVHEQTTGFFEWDMEPRAQAPEHINQWVEGEPKNWHS